MRLLLFSDLHLDAPSTGTSAVELRAAFARIGELVRDLQVDAVCCAGNLFDQNALAPDTDEVLWNGFAEIHPVPVFLVPGSSDWYAPSSMYRKPWSDNVHVFTQAHLTPLTIGNGITLWGAAHIAPTQQLGFLSSGDTRPDGVNLALFHGCEQADFDQQRMDGPLTAPFRAHQIRQAGFDHALVGHLREPVAAEDYTYAGRPGPDRGDGSPVGGAVLVTVHSDGSVDQRWHALFTGSPFAKATERLAQDRDDPPPGPASTATPSTTTGVFTKAPPVATPARAAAAAQERAERDPFDTPQFAESTVRGQFIRSIRRGELSRDDQNRVLRIGLAAIDGQSDFGEL